jgi:predicted nucleic acid-binding protein
MWNPFTGHSLYLDTNVIIFSVEQGNPWSEVLRKLFEAIDERAVHCFTSELTLAEVLAKPFSVGASDLIAKYEQILASDSLIKVVPVGRPILRMAAELQGQYGVKLADAIHLATAKQCACDLVLTNDKRLGRKMQAEFRWLSLSEMAASSPAKGE